MPNIKEEPADSFEMDTRIDQWVRPRPKILRILLQVAVSLLTTLQNAYPSRESFVRTKTCNIEPYIQSWNPQNPEVIKTGTLKVTLFEPLFEYQNVEY